MGRKNHFSKPIRVWILGASICATIFLALSCYYDFWVMKTLKNERNNFEDTSYFGLWKKCNDLRPKDRNGKKQLMTTTCQTFGDGGLLKITGTPGFIKSTRGFLIATILIIGISSLVTACIMFASNRSVFYFAAGYSLTATILGIIVMGIFIGKINNTDLYKDYSMAWTFYYFLIGWVFTGSTFVASFADKPIV